MSNNDTRLSNEEVDETAGTSRGETDQNQVMQEQENDREETQIIDLVVYDASLDERREYQEFERYEPEFDQVMIPTSRPATLDQYKLPSYDEIEKNPILKLLTNPSQQTIPPSYPIQPKYNSNTYVRWQQLPTIVPHLTPIELVLLTEVTSLLVVSSKYQQLSNMMSDSDRLNNYFIYNQSGLCMYFAYEQTNQCSDICFGDNKDFDIHIFNEYYREVIYLRKQCSSYCICLPKLEIYSPSNTPLGIIKQKFNMKYFLFEICDEEGKPILIIKTKKYFNNNRNKYLILTPQNLVVGSIENYTGMFQGKNSNTYNLTFPCDMSVEVKATLIGAVFLIKYVVSDKKCHFCPCGSGPITAALFCVLCSAACITGCVIHG